MKLFLILLINLIVVTICFGVESNYYSVKSSKVQCKKPPCQSIFISKLNTDEEGFLATFDFAATVNARLDKHLMDNVDDQESPLTLYGFITQNKDKSKNLRIQRASNASPVPVTLCTVELNTNKETILNTVNFEYLKQNFKFDEGWFNARLFDENPESRLVAQARISKDGVADISRSFVSLPDPHKPCPKFTPPRYVKGRTPIYTREDDRCYTFEGYVSPGVCSKEIPECNDHYRLVSYPAAPNGCPSYYCDPEFLDIIPLPKYAPK
eukprot:gene3963-4957_t